MKPPQASFMMCSMYDEYNQIHVPMLYFAFEYGHVNLQTFYQLSKEQ